MTIDRTENIKESDPTNPSYYRNKIEVIDFIEAYDLPFCLANAVKYIARCGSKHEEGMTDDEKAIEDLKKSVWYVNRRIKELEEGLCS